MWMSCSVMVIDIICFHSSFFFFFLHKGFNVLIVFLRLLVAIVNDRNLVAANDRVSDVISVQLESHRMVWHFNIHNYDLHPEIW